MFFIMVVTACLQRKLTKEMATKFIPGMEVILCYKREVVAFATIHESDPNSICHFRRLGEDKVAVIVSRILSAHVEVKHKCGDMEILGDVMPYNTSNKAFIAWDRDETYPTHVIRNTKCISLDFRVGDILQMLSFANKNVAEGQVLGFEQVEHWTFAQMRIQKVTDDGMDDNSVSLDGPYYKVGKDLRWSMQFLKIGKTRHVVFNDKHNVYYNIKELKEYANVPSSILSEMDDFNALNYRTDVL